MADWTPPEVASEGWVPPEVGSPAISTRIPRDLGPGLEGSLSARVGPRLKTREPVPFANPLYEVGRQFAKVTPKNVVREGAAVLDIVGPQGVAQVATNALGTAFGRAFAASSGIEDRDEINRIGAEFGSELASNPLIDMPLTRLVKWASGDSKATSAEEVMGKVTEALGKGGEWMEEKSGGAVKKADVDLVTSVLFARLGIGGYGKLAEARARAATTPKVEPTLEGLNKAVGDFQAGRGKGSAEDLYAQAAGEGEVKPTEPAAPQPAADMPNLRKAGMVDEFGNPLVPPKKGKKGKAGFVDEFGKPLAVAAVAGGAAYTLGADPEEIALASIVGVPLAKRRAKVNELLPDSAQILDRAEAFGPSALPMLDQYRMSLAEKGASPAALAAFDDYVRGMEKLSEPLELPGFIFPLNADQEGLASLAVLPLAAILKANPATPLREFTPRLRYSTRVLEMMTKELGDRATFSAAQVKGFLGRQGITGAEREMFAGIMEGKESISARDLVAGVKERTGDFKLKAKEAGEYAGYGLSEIGRAGEEQRAYVPDTVPARTTIYQSPVELGTANHFSDPNYFAHTRSFDEGGVRHVVEIQSDVAQKAEKRLTEGERADLQSRLDYYGRARAGVESLLDMWKSGSYSLNQIRAAAEPLRRAYEEISGPVVAPEEFLQRGKRTIEVLRVREAELQAKLSKSDVIGPVRPILKDWWKRLIREEVAQAVAGAAKARAKTQNLIESKRRTIAEMEQTLAALSTPESWTIPLKQKIEGLAYDLDVLAMDLRNGRVSEGTARQYMLRTEAELPLSARARWTEYWESYADEIGDYLRPGRGEEGVWGNAYASNFPKVFAEFLRKELGQSDTTLYKEVVKNYQEDIARLASTPRIIRFATADTVAKVEGWPKIFDKKDILPADSPTIGPELLEASLKRYEKDLRSNAAGKEEALQKIPQQMKTATDNAKKVLDKYGYVFDRPPHAGLYLGYVDEISPFLRKEYKARDYTDPHGHTWLEADLPPDATPIRLWGMGATAAGAALTAMWLDGGDESPLALAALAATPAPKSGLVRRLAGPAFVIGGASALAYAAADPKDAAYYAGGAAVLTGLAAFAHHRSPQIRNYAQGAGLAAEVLYGNMSTMLKGMSPALLRKVRNFEWQNLTHKYESLKLIDKTVDGLLKLPRNVRDAVDIALFNNERAVALKLVPKELVGEMQKAFKFLDDEGAKLLEMGLLKRLDPGYWPRVIKDLDGLFAKLEEISGKKAKDYLAQKLEDAAGTKARKTGDTLNDMEVSAIVNEHIQAAINRSDSPGQAGMLKKRTIKEVYKDILPFYETAADSIAIYAKGAAREIERAKFFGKDLVKAKGTNAVQLDASIGRVVKAEREAGRLKDEQLKRLEMILQARFGPGERSGNTISRTYRNVVQALLLGNPYSAFVQFGDVGLAAVVHGVRSAVTGVVKTLVPGAEKWRLNEMGLADHVLNDFDTGVHKPFRVGSYELSTAKFLQRTLKFSGFSLVDSFAKLVNMNAAADRFGRLARTERGRAEIARQYGEYFGADLPQLIKDLKAGKKSHLVGELIFAELSDVQPLTMIDKPLAYAKYPSMRPYLTLKGFMVKQMGLVWERGVREIRKGDAASVLRGMSFLTRYALAMGLAGASLAYITRWIQTGQPPRELPDAGDVAENVFKTFGWGSYTFDELKKGNPTKAVGMALTPPWKLFDDIWKTPTELRKLKEGEAANPKGVSYFPIVGKDIYLRALGGNERRDANEERRKRIEENRKLFGGE